MNNYNETLRAGIQAAITTPADPKISGSILQGQLLNIVNAVCAGAKLMGKASPNTVPATEDNCFYAATQSGTYTNFVTTSGNAITLGNGEIAFLKSVIYQNNLRWQKISIFNATEPQVFTTEQQQVQRDNIGAAASEGEEPNLVAGDIIPTSSEPQGVTVLYRMQTTGGEVDIKSGPSFLDSIKGFLDAKMNPFLADTFVSTGMNLVDPSQYLVVKGRKAYYFPVAPGVWGAYGTTTENNGYIIISETVPDGVYFSVDKPTAAAYGSACNYHTHESVKYYTPEQIGWMTIIMPDNTVPACHVEWSGYMNNTPGSFGNVLKNIASDITAVHPWGISGLVGADRSSFDEVSYIAGKRYARNDRSLLTSLVFAMTTYDTDDESPVTHFVFEAPVPGMASNGLWRCDHEGVVMEGTTLKIDSTKIKSVEDLMETFGPHEYIYFEKSSVVSTNISDAASKRANTVNDYGLSYFLYGGELVSVPAYVTEEFYQTGKVQLFNNAKYTQGEMSEVITAAVAFLEAAIDGILEAFSQGLPYLKVQELTVARKLNAYITDGNAMLTGEGAPTMIPQFNGHEYYDKTNATWYKASYTGSAPTAAAWKPITNA